MRQSKPVSVLFTVRELNCGGIERDVTKIAIGIDRTKFEPHVASYQSSGMRFDELTRAGIPLLHVPFPSFKSATSWKSALKLARYIRKHKIRLVHAYDASAVFVAPIARMLGVPAVISATVSYRNLLDPRSQSQVRWTDGIVDSIVVNCEAMRRHMIDDEHAQPERIELCYNGVDTTQFFPGAARKPEAIANASLVIGTICVLRPEKALDVLQEGFALARNLKPGLKLVIVGSGPELSRLQENGRRLGIENDCVFVPATSQVPEFLRSFDIFVQCSRSEAFSNTLLEAMACGCACIGSRVGGTPELTGNDERGLLFRSGDSADLAEKLGMFISDARMRKQFGNAAAEFAHTKLNVEIAAARMAEIYQTVLLRKGAWDLPVSAHSNPAAQSVSELESEHEVIGSSK